MSEELKKIKDLEGTWRFSIGDDLAWAAPEFNDSGWDFISVPRSWESNGYIGYNGYAWYRKSFSLDREISGQYVFLVLGTIDDVDEVYVNGKLIGHSGVFPVLVQTAFNVPRKYPVPVELLNPNGKNVVAVRVYDEYHEGGIINGRIGIYVDEEASMLKQDLSGYWKFEANAKPSTKDKGIYNKAQGEIFVPGFWENLGYPDYDGHAVYTTEFLLNNRIDPNSEQYIVLGYIDDKDEVYLNGKKIGDVDDINRGSRNYYRIFRLYKIPAGLLESSKPNVLRVEVHDTGELGGMYEGPIGITDLESGKRLRKKREESSDYYWHDFIKSIFD